MFKRSKPLVGLDIGSSGNFVDIELEGTLTATAGRHIFLNEVNQEGLDGGILKADVVQSTGGDVHLRAYESIVSVNDSATVPRAASACGRGSRTIIGMR